MFGLLDISHRFKFSNAPSMSSNVRTQPGESSARSRQVQSIVTKLLYDYFAEGPYRSIEEYISSYIHCYEKIPDAVGKIPELDGIEVYRVFDTFFAWQSKDAEADSAKAISNFVHSRNKLFGDIFRNSGNTLRDVDEASLPLEKFVKNVASIFALDDVVLWRYNPENEFLIKSAATFSGKVNADVSRGVVAEAVKNGRAMYYPNIRRKQGYLDLVQHPQTFQRRSWKGMLVCPLHLGSNIVGVVGLYSKHDLIFSKAELGLVLYMLANLSKRMSREVFGGRGEDESGAVFSYDKLTKLAPTIYAGTKTTYRLHSIKNKVRSAAEVLKEIERHVPKKLVNEINWRTRTRDVRKETLEIFQELESCLLIGSQRNSKLFKNRPVKTLVEKIRSMIINHVSPEVIEREFSYSYARDAEIFADQVSLEQAIYNVVENSFHFLSVDYLHRRDPKIHVDVQQIEDDLVIQIVDNANGMDEDERLSARNLYYSGPRKNGSGVGLWMTERIMNDHVGEFDFDSDLGGTTSKIVVPLEVKGASRNWVKGKFDLLGDDD